ncbi:MAG: TetR/AcrR family transcriptional regulator [Eubacterium sp.]|nr:TetR/AcrR family transcriptional regulator [Eubacterium sp.]
MPPRVFTEEEREKLRELMLDQAIPLLEEYGLKHMSVDKITSKVGIGKSTFYNFFSSKEEYVSYALEHNRKKLLDNLDKQFPQGKKMKPAEIYNMLFKGLLSSNSIYEKLTAEDERSLYEADKARGKNVSLERETMIASRLMAHMDGVRKDLNVGLISNYIKLIVLAYENSYMFHDSEMEHMQAELKLRVIDMIFEEDAKRELMEMIKKENADYN